jgi:tetraacyldisaccharide 4'-kinase
MLPRGPYREPTSALARASFVVVTRRAAADARLEETLRRVSRLAPGRPTAVLTLKARAWTDLSGAPASTPAGSLLAVAGVAEPGLFVHLVAEATGELPELLAFPDHHDFDEADARHIRGVAGRRTVVVTEKDAVKLLALQDDLPTVRVLTLSVHPERGGRELEEALAHALARGEGS